MIRKKTPLNTFFLRTNHGLTMTETLVSVLVGGILLLMMQITHRAATGIEQVVSARMETQTQLIQASAYILKDLRNAGSTSITNVPADSTWYSNAITFYTATGESGSSITWDSNAITFSLSGTNLSRTYNSVSRVIATDITLFRLYRSSAVPEMISINIESTNSTTYGGDVTSEFTFIAKLRN